MMEDDPPISVLHPLIHRGGCTCPQCRLDFQLECIHVLEWIPPPPERPVGGPSGRLKHFLNRLYPEPQTLMDAYVRVMTCVQDPDICRWLDTVEGCIAWRVWWAMGIYVLSQHMAERMEEMRTYCRCEIEAIGVEWMHIIYSNTQDEYFFQEPDQCSLCLENIYDPVVTNCGHTFHHACLQRAYFDCSRCPECRRYS